MEGIFEILIINQILLIFRSLQGTEELPILVYVNQMP